MVNIWWSYEDELSVNEERRLLEHAILGAMDHATIYLRYTLSVMSREVRDPWLSSILECIFGSADEGTHFYVKGQCKTSTFCLHDVKFCAGIFESLVRAFEGRLEGVTIVSRRAFLHLLDIVRTRSPEMWTVRFLNGPLQPTVVLKADLPAQHILDRFGALAWHKSGVITLLSEYRDVPVWIERKPIKYQTPMGIHTDLTWLLIHETLHLLHNLPSTRNCGIFRGKQ